MSSGLLRAVLDEFITESGINSARMRNVKQLASLILLTATKSDNSLLQFDKFSLELHEILRETATLDTRFKLQSTQRTKAWEKFHTLRIGKLRTMWEEFLKNVGILNNDTGYTTIALLTLLVAHL